LGGRGGREEFVFDAKGAEVAMPGVPAEFFAADRGERTDFFHMTLGRVWGRGRGRGRGKRRKVGEGGGDGERERVAFARGGLGDDEGGETG
jgi:hypothetical protein